MSRTLYADDCLNVLKDELAIPTESVDLIYLDPPFNSKSQYNLPFKGKYKSARPVEAFKDTWEWGDTETALLEEFRKGPSTRLIADLVRVAQRVEPPTVKYSLAAYLTNMAARLIPIRRVLKPTGSIYLHCDSTASHYLKIIMDAVFGKDHFRNEIVWSYRRWPSKSPHFQTMHDVLLRYTKGPNFTWNQLYEPLSPATLKRFGRKQQVADFSTGKRLPRQTEDDSPNAPMRDVWDIGIIAPVAKERLGYPTQKPLALLKRIIRASSNRGDMVLDPFCGCGTSMHAAEALMRKWVGIDISTFSTGLVRNRIRSTFPFQVEQNSIRMLGVPDTPDSARALASADKFEFEKWACGHVGAEGLFHAPGTRGADRGVDGVLKFYPMHWNEKPKPHYAIVQVKGGGVTPDAVRALSGTVEQFEATAGVLICFDDQMRTVENNRIKRTFHDVVGEYPVIQGLAVEDMLRGDSPKLPNLLQKAA